MLSASGPQPMPQDAALVSSRNRRPLSSEVLNDKPDEQRVVSRHQNSKWIRRRRCTPLAVSQARRVTAMPSDLLCLERQVAGGGDWSCGLACVHCCCSGSTSSGLEGLSLPGWLSPSSALVCRTGMVSAGSAQSACSMREAHAHGRVCAPSARETACPRRDSARSRLGAQAGPPPCPLRARCHQARSEFRLCARGRPWVCAVSVPRRSPPPVSRYSCLQSLHLHFPPARLLAASVAASSLLHSPVCSSAAAAIRAGPPTHRQLACVPSRITTDQPARRALTA